MKGLTCLLFFAGLFGLCYTQEEDIACNVTEEAEGTLYSVPEFKANQCFYVWSNNTDHVLAAKGEKSYGHVVNHSSRTLLIKECEEVIIYRRDCISEGMQRTVNCTTNCSRNAGYQRREGTGRSYLITMIIVGILMLITVAIVLYAVRRTICRNHLFTAVTRDNPDVNDVEAQHG